MREGQHYDVVIVNVDMLDSPWALVERLVGMEPPIGSVLVTTANRSWAMHERAEQAGCRALLDKPFDPEPPVSRATDGVAGERREALDAAQQSGLEWWRFGADLRRDHLGAQHRIGQAA